MIVPGLPRPLPSLEDLRPKPVRFDATCPGCDETAPWVSRPFPVTSTTEMTPSVRSTSCVLDHEPCGPCPCASCDRDRRRAA